MHKPRLTFSNLVPEGYPWNYKPREKDRLACCLGQSQTSPQYLSTG